MLICIYMSDSQIFHTLKAPIDKYYATVLLGAAELIGTIICVILVHFTGKRPLVLLSAVGCAMCFLGTATYARFLYLVPGVTVDNVVANVSALDLNKANFISTINASAIVDMEDAPPPSSTQTANLSVNDSKAIWRYSLQNYENAVLSGTLNDDKENFEENEMDDFEPIENSTEIYMNQTASKHTRKDPDGVSTEVPPEPIVLKVSKTVKNKYLWVPLTLLIMSALFAHIGLRLIPWMLIGEVYL